MSYSLDSDIQEDLRTFPMYQRLRKINPYAYYSLNTQKQMQLDLRTSGSPNFFMVDPDTMPETDEPTGKTTLPEALAKAELLIDTGSSGFNEKTETILGILYATDTVPIRRSTSHGDKHKIFVALITLMDTAYKAAKARLHHATYAYLERLRAEFDMYRDGSIPIIHYNIYDEWFASIGGVKTHQVKQQRWKPSAVEQL